MTTTDPAERLRLRLRARDGMPFHREGSLEAALDAALAAEYQRGRDEAVLNVLWLSHAIEAHTARWPAHEPIHDDGTCSTDCAGDIAARYRAEPDAQADR